MQIDAVLCYAAVHIAHSAGLHVATGPQHHSWANGAVAANAEPAPHMQQSGYRTGAISRSVSVQLKQQSHHWPAPASLARSASVSTSVMPAHQLARDVDRPILLARAASATDASREEHRGHRSRAFGGFPPCASRGCLYNVVLHVRGGSTRDLMIQLVCYSGEGSREEWRSVERTSQHSQTSSIVSLAPHCTEVLFALGLGHRVIGVTVSYCAHFCAPAAFFPRIALLPRELYGPHSPLMCHRTSVISRPRLDSGITSAAVYWTPQPCPVQR